MTFAVVALAGACLAIGASEDPLRPTGLQCNGLTDPLGVDDPAPRLSWTLESGRRGDRQTAYRIVAASTVRGLAAADGLLWDTGRVESAESLHIPYGGRRLEPGQRVHWRVQVWDAAEVASEWSPAASFEMGRMGDWQATWIEAPWPEPASDEDFYADQPAPHFRSEFTIAKPVRRARAYVSGLGYYELRLNGAPAGDHVLDPGWTEYAHRVFYATLDITDMVRPGRNCVGAIVGNGFWNPLPLRMWGGINLRQHLTVGPPRLICQLEIEYADGSSERVVSDDSWRVARGPIRRNSVYLGEAYDARLEMPGWDLPGYDDGAWDGAVRCAQALGALQAQPLSPIRVTDVFEPIGVTEPVEGVRIYDFGQNMAGRASLTIEAPAGAQVRLRYGELLHPDGSLNPLTSVCGQIKSPGMGGPGAPDLAVQEDSYVARGEGVETWTPRFAFHGFRYVEVTGAPASVSLRAQRLHSDLQPVGRFECSDPLLNGIEGLCRQALLSNLHSVQSDCPHREKFGYGGDIVASSEYAMMLLDMQAFYGKCVRDFGDAQRANGGFTETAPYVGIADGGFGEGSGPIGWGTAHPLLIWQLRQYYGETALMAEQYERAARWLAMLVEQSDGLIISHGIGDHESLVPKPTALTSTAFLALNADLVARMAGLLGRTEDEARYSELAKRAQEALNDRFLDPTTGRYDAGTQTCQSMVLSLGLVPPSSCGDVLDRLVEDLMAEGEPRLTTGIFGTKYLLESLTANGRADLAYRLAKRREFPSWGYMLDNGATTLWEVWSYSDNVFSHNHPMFGSIAQWLYQGLAGIRPHDTAVGFDHVVIAPYIPDDLQWLRAEYRSVRGPIRCEWERVGGRLSLLVSLPPNATGVLVLPGDVVDQIPVEAGIEWVDHTDGATRVALGSGSYVFGIGDPRE